MDRYHPVFVVWAIAVDHLYPWIMTRYLVVRKKKHIIFEKHHEDNNNNR